MYEFTYFETSLRWNIDWYGMIRCISIVRVNSVREMVIV